MDATPIAVACPVCGGLHEADAAFCPRCGAACAALPAVGERDPLIGRQVIGST